MTIRLPATRLSAYSFPNQPILSPAELPQALFDNPPRDWGLAMAIAGSVALLLYGVRTVLARRLQRLAQRTATDVDDVAVEILRKTRWYFILTLAIRAGSIALTLTPSLHSAIHRAAAIAVLLQLAVWGNALVAFWLRRWAGRRAGDDKLGESTLRALGFAAKGLIWSLILVLALRNVLDYDISALLTGLGIGGIAIALAVQNVLGDLFAALSIVLDRPFEVGDTIAVDTFTGTVEHIGLKTTRLRAVTGEQVIFSNADLLKSRVRNLKRMQERRALVTLGIPYDTPPDRVGDVPAILQRCVEAQPATRFDRAHFARFAESWLEFELAYFVRSPEYLTFMDTQQAVNLGILRAFGEEKIGFAFPTRTIVERSERPVA